MFGHIGKTQLSIVRSWQRPTWLKCPAISCRPYAKLNSDFYAVDKGLCGISHLIDWFCYAFAHQDRFARCKAGGMGKPELKRNHKYFHQGQGAKAITTRLWCTFVVWTPTRITVECIPFDTRLWAETKPKCLNFYKKAIPELTLPWHTHGQLIQEPTSGNEVTTWSMYISFIPCNFHLCCLIYR